MAAMALRSSIQGFGVHAPSASRCRCAKSAIYTDRTRQKQWATRATASGNDTQGKSEGLAPDHIMLAILDANPYLNDGSKQAAAMAAGMAGVYGSKMTVLCIDDKPSEDENAIRMTCLKEQMKGREFEVLDQVAPASAAVACGDVADARGADLLILSADAVHRHAVDANLLAEFVPCPIMLLP